MKKNKSLLIALLAFVLLLGGAYVLYDKLAPQAAPDQLALQSGVPAEQAPDTQASDAQAPDTQASDTQTSDTQASDTQAAPEAPPEEEVPEKLAAPDFTVYTTEGTEAHLTDYIGKPIVLNFWASWCGPCQIEMPDFHEKYLELGDEVNFLMVNMTTGRETQESAEAFIEENGYTFPVFFDTQSEAAMAYGAYSLPTTFFIDAQGYAIAQATGAIDGATLQRGIDMITAQP